MILAAALTGVTCGFPTDESDKVFITLQAPSGIVLRGQDMSIYAQAWRAIGADTQPINNVPFAFTTGSSSIAVVQNDGGGYATVTGVNSGLVNIAARAVGFENAQQADLLLRVSNPLEVDSVRPSVAHHGEVVTIYGVGVDSLFIASLAGVNLIEYPFSRLRDSSGLGQISFWVPPPARSDSLFFLGAGVFGFDRVLTNIVFADVFEPNDTVPTSFNLDAPGPWPGTVLDPIVFTNPALAFEPVERSKSGEDWYRFVTVNAAQPVTVFINYPSFGGDTSGTRIFLIDSLDYLENGDPSLDPIEKFVGRDSADFIGSAFYRCKGFVFAPPQAPRESTTVALKSLPSRALHILTNFTRAQRYGLSVARGYFTADPRIDPDAYEENDMCTYADSSNRRIALAAPPSAFSDTLTIDNPFEVDWLRFDLPGTGPVAARFRTIPRPFGAVGTDVSDIDLYVLTTPNPGTGTSLTVVALDTTAGSMNDVSFVLNGGQSYYVAVVDFAGVPVRYRLCFALGLSSACSTLTPTGGMGTTQVRSGRPSRAGPSRGHIVDRDASAKRSVLTRGKSSP